MKYLARWRMQKATRLLKQTVPVETIAQHLGYDSDRAFRKAFKREIGLPSATYRRQQLASAQPQQAFLTIPEAAIYQLSVDHNSHDTRNAVRCILMIMSHAVVRARLLNKGTLCDERQSPFSGAAWQWSAEPGYEF
jgi:hypothetical protein